MTNPQEHGLRVCPTRIDGSGVLVSHKVDRGQCQDRQRGRYHKCFTCAYNNAYVKAHGLPEPAAEPVPEPVELAEEEVPVAPELLEVEGELVTETKPEPKTIAVG